MQCELYNDNYLIITISHLDSKIDRIFFHDDDGSSLEPNPLFMVRKQHIFLKLEDAIRLVRACMQRFNK